MLRVDKFGAFKGNDFIWPEGRSNSTLGVRLPTLLKRGMEQLTGLNLSQVRVHYASLLPALVHAHGYAQGNQIYLALGQEQHLAHELGHVVQQKLGLVKPTTEVNGVLVNDDPQLEQEATELGLLALKAGTCSISFHPSTTQATHLKRLLKLA